MDAARRLHPAFNRAFEHEEAELFALLDPEAEWIPLTAVLERTSYHGHDGVRQWIEEMQRDWEVFETKPDEFRDLGDDRVLILGTWRARGRGSGVELSTQQAAWLLSCKGGKVVRLQTFTDRERAFEAAGLR
jgi:ketosteroid isomerase-like protein